MESQSQPSSTPSIAENQTSSGDVDKLVQAADAENQTQELDPKTERELGEVEQALEDYTLGIEDRS